MIDHLKKFNNLRVSHLLQKEGHRRALLCTTCEVDSALQLVVTGLSALIFPDSQNQWNIHWIPNASILPEPLMIPQYFSTPQMYVGQDWELQWSYMVKCEFQPHCSKHFRAQRIHTQHPRKQAPLFFSAALCEPGDALTLDCIFQRTDLNSDGETNAALHMEKHCVNDVSKPVMNFQGLATAKEDLGDISRRYSLETDHQNRIKHLKNKSLRFDLFLEEFIQISIQMIHTSSWQFRKLWF